MNISIKKFTSDQQEPVKKFIIDVWKEFEGYVYEQELDYDLDDPEKYYLKPGGMFYILTIDDIIRGTIGIINKENDVAEFKRFYIDKNHRGKGYGSQLLDKALEFCRNNGFKKIEFETDKIFETAHLLYKKHGFTVIKEDDNILYMRKILKNSS